MATGTLVDRLLDDGQKLAEALAKRGFSVDAALWLQSSENEKWYFYVVSPLVDAEGLSKAYGRLHSATRGMAKAFWIDPLEIRLIGPTDPIAKQVLEICKRYPPPVASPIRWRGKTLGNMSVEQAYIYPLKTSTP